MGGKPKEGEREAMRRVIRLGLAASFVLALAIPAGAQSASNGAPAANDPAAAPHNFETSLSKEQSEARALALEM